MPFSLLCQSFNGFKITANDEQGFVQGWHSSNVKPGQKPIEKTKVQNIFCRSIDNGRVGQSISALAAQRTVRESLPSYGSCYSVSV